MIISLVNNGLDPILSAAALGRKALYQRTLSISAFTKSLASALNVERVAVIALSQIAQPGISAREVIRSIVKSAPDARIVVVADSAHRLFPADRSWLQVSSNVTIATAVEVGSLQHAGAGFLAQLFPEGDYAADLRRMAPFLKALDTNPQRTSLEVAIARGIDYESVATALFGNQGIAITNRRYRLTTYPEVFLAREAAQWMQRRFNYSSDDALLAGRAMQEAGLIYHVVREQQFAEEDFFFRVATYPSGFSWINFLNNFFAKDGPARKDRTYHAKTYPRCLQGQEMVDWMRAQNFSDNEAMTIGQRMIDLNIIHHVADEQPFRAANLFFRARQDEMSKAQPSPFTDAQFKSA